MLHRTSVRLLGALVVAILVICRLIANFCSPGIFEIPKPIPQFRCDLLTDTSFNRERIQCDPYI